MVIIAHFQGDFSTMTKKTINEMADKKRSHPMRQVKRWEFLECRKYGAIIFMPCKHESESEQNKSNLYIRPNAMSTVMYESHKFIKTFSVFCSRDYVAQHVIRAGIDNFCSLRVRLFRKQV